MFSWLSLSFKSNFVMFKVHPKGEALLTTMMFFRSTMLHPCEWYFQQTCFKAVPYHMFLFFTYIVTYSTCTCVKAHHMWHMWPQQCHRCQIWLLEATALLRGWCFSFFFTFRETVVCPPCSGLVGVLQSEEGPDRQLMLYAGMVE